MHIIKIILSAKYKPKELTVLKSWTPYCQIQTQIEESRENHQTTEVWPKSNPLWLYSGSEKEILGIRSDRVPEELWMEVRDIVQEAVIKTIPKTKKHKKAKWLSEEAL